MEAIANQAHIKILRVNEVVEMTGLSKCSVLKMEKSGQFPKKVKLSVGAVGWLLSEVTGWLQERADNR
jgi:prophage regulatory protein